MTEHLQHEQRLALPRGSTGRRTRTGRARGALATVLRRSAQCLPIAPAARSESGAPTHRIIFTCREGDELPEAAKRMTRAFGLGLAIVLSVRSARCLCRVFAVSGTHADGVASLHFTVSLRQFAAERVSWRRRPAAAAHRRVRAQPIGATLPLPL